MKNIFTGGGHLTSYAVKSLFDGSLDDMQSFKIAQHTALCPLCCARLETRADQCSPAIPRGTAELVVYRIQQEKQHQKSEFTRFVMQIAACVIVSIGVLSAGFFLPHSTGLSAPSSPEPIVIRAPRHLETQAADPSVDSLLERAQIALNNLMDIF